MTKNNDNSRIIQWLSDNNVQDVEVLVSDFAGISRGKKMPANKFIKSLGSGDLRIPDSIFGMTVDCDFVGNDFITDVEQDVFLVPDFTTAGLVPWADSVTAYFICDVVKQDGTKLNMSPRQVLKNVLALYEQKNWRAVIAPEFEFTLLAKRPLANQVDQRLIKVSCHLMAWRNMAHYLMMCGAFVRTWACQWML